MALDENFEAFIVYMALFISKIIIHLVCKALMALFIIEKIFVLAKYADFANIFLKKVAKIMLE